MKTHFLEHGMTACLHPVPSHRWPAEETWTNKWDLVTCPECLEGKEVIKTYTISPDESSITCLRCKMTSHNPTDVSERYCGNCKEFHDSIWKPARKMWITNPSRNIIKDTCPFCQETLNGQVGPSHLGRQMKDEGDVVFCANCAEPSVYQHGVLVKPDAKFKEILDADERVAAIKAGLKAFQENKSRTVVFSSADEKYHPLARFTFPLMEIWAARHGFKPMFFKKAPPGLNAYWFGVFWAIEFLKQGYKRVICLDADQVITNSSINFNDIPYKGFHASKDWGSDATEPWHFSMCGFIAHIDCFPLLKMVLDLEPQWRDKPFQEQGPFQDVVRRMMGDLPHMKEMAPGETMRGLINVHPRKKFNSVPDFICPGNVPEPWQPGDFAAHLTMVPIEQRIDLIRKLEPHIQKDLSDAMKAIVADANNQKEDSSHVHKRF